MRSVPVVAAVVAVCVVLGTVVGLAAASSATVELAEVDAEGEQTETVSFQFVADANTSVSAPASETTDGGHVTFEFDGWSGGGDSGSDSSWDVTEGETYHVEYVVRVESGASEGSHSVTVSDGQSGQFSEQLSVTVAAPAFGTIQDQDAEVVFHDDDAQTKTVSVSVPNSGDGVMFTDGATVDDDHDDIDVEVGSLTNEIDNSGTLELDIEIDPEAEEGSYDVDVIVSETLGDTESFTLTIDVRKPPVAEVEDDTIDLGDVLVGESNTTEFTIEEAAGFSGIDGMEEAEIIWSPPDGEVEFDGLTGFGGVSTDAGGSDEAEATVTIEDDVEQHATPSWDVELTPDDEHSPTTGVEVIAHVIYPPELGDVEADADTFVFDEPRTEVTAQEETASVEISNVGDLEMDVTSMSASVDSPSIDATVVDEPAGVDGLDEETVQIDLDADPDTPEGTYTLTVDVETEDAGSETVTEEFDVEYDSELVVDRSDVQFGEVTVTERQTQSIDVAERLEYVDLEDVTVEQVDGPDAWITITEAPPSEVDAGDSAPLVFEVVFDTEAEPYEEYLWVFEVDADGVESETIEVRGTARLLSVEDIVNDLEDRSGDGGWQEDTATPSAESLIELETRLQDGEAIDDGDVWRSISIGQSIDVLIGAVENAETQQADDDYDAAQDDVVSALATHSLIVEYGSDIEDDDLRTELLTAADTAEEPVEAVAEEQESHYREILDDSDSTALDRAQANQQLAEMVDLRGNDEAEDLRAESDEEFERYRTLVEDGTEFRQDARDRQDAFDDSATMVVFGQPFVLNPARLDELGSHSDTVTEEYTAAVEAFEEAGADAEAEAAAAERDDAETGLTITRFILYGVTGISSIAFVGLVVRLGSNSVAYVRDVRTATSGDFLV